MTTFKFGHCEDNEASIMVHTYCEDMDEATSVKDELQSLGGSHIEQDDNFLYCVFSGDQGPSVVQELEDAGYETDTSEVDF